MNRSAYPSLGAHLEGQGVRFAVFTQAASCSVELLDDDGSVRATHQLEPLGDGYFQSFVAGVGAGALYWFVLDGRRLPDPYARFLPRGVHGPAQVVDPSYAFEHLPPSRPLSQQVVYELHVGTFTDEGTFASARQRLPALAELGVTCIELMPVAAFAGERGWGYDGVALFAPHSAYGTPDELKALVDSAHGLGLAVLLDVVYNHFGPSGNYLSAYSSTYFSAELHNAWGQAPNFAEPALRQLVLDNARYWLHEFGFDGLRLDATHAILDTSPKHILTELAELSHEASPRRLLMAEDERNQADLVTQFGLDALWADDFHHQLRVTISGERSGYYAAYEPGAQGVADAINRGWLYTGQRSPLTGQARGSAADALPAEALVYCIQNHDQIGNRAFGDRLAPGEAFRAASMLLLFLPMTPLLFMGQEWAARSPFLYFTDHEAKLGKAVSEGRRREFAGFPEFSEPERQRAIPDPQAPETFAASKLRWSERDLPEHRATWELYRAALALRKSDPVLVDSDRARLLAQVEDGALIVHRWLGNERRVLVVNFSRAALRLESLPGWIRLRSARALLQSSPGAGSVVPAHGAVLLAGEGTLAGLVEGMS